MKVADAPDSVTLVVLAFGKLDKLATVVPTIEQLEGSIVVVETGRTSDAETVTEPHWVFEETVIDPVDKNRTDVVGCGSVD